MSQKLEYKGITFDDFADDRDDFRVPKYWSQICESCYKKYGYKMPYISIGGDGICGVEGCENEANYYIDFDNAEVKMTNVPFVRTITKKVAEEIIEFREPLGLYILQEGDGYVGIDNTTGDAWCEEFTSKYDCVKWLTGDDSKCHSTHGTSLLIEQSAESLLQDAITGIETVAVRDKQLESLWEQFADVPMNPNTECLEEEFIHFPAGTHREEVWRWFDERHSKSVAYLLYGSQESEAPSLDTPIGKLTVEKTTEESGFWITLHRPEGELPLALTEYSKEDDKIITRVWGDGRQEDYTSKTIHEGVEEYFKEEE